MIKSKYYFSFILFICFSFPLLAQDDHSPEYCGTFLGLSCEQGQYCNYGIGNCGIPDAEGICEQTPDICTDEFIPVCGCNGQTYGNACEAAANGQTIAHIGECGKLPTFERYNQ